MNDLQYADDNVVPCHSVNRLQQVPNCWVDAYSAFGLTVNKKKTKTLHLGSLLSPPEDNPITTDGTDLEKVNNFQYLGSLLSNNGTIDEEKCVRIAHTAYGRLYN